MATITRTIGTGGDFTDWGAALEWIRTNDNPMTNDYELVQISDCTLSAEMTAPGLIMNEHTLRLYCPFEQSHKGNVNRGFETIAGGFSLYVLTRAGGGPGVSTGIGVVTIENLRMVGNSNAYIRISGEDQHTHISNVIILGNNGYNQYGIYTQTVNSLTRMWVKNVKVYNTGGTGIGNTTGGTHALGTAENYLENCTVYNCGRNCDASHAYGVGVPENFWMGQNWHLKNVVSFRDAGQPGADFQIGVNDGPRAYCAASDASLPTGSGNIRYIVPADEFESLDVANDNFLRLIGNGYKTAKASASPLAGLAPHTVNFSGFLDIQRSGAGGLATAGGEPVYATDDIEGYPRPGDDNLYSIGAHEFQYEWLNVV